MLLFGVQDQVDTLTFQNRSLRDRAKRFEEALRRSTDEQIVVIHYRTQCWLLWWRLKRIIHQLLIVVITNTFCCWQDALEPYKHIEEDLKSLKEVLEMKNQQIHHQEVKISELEKIVGSNVLFSYIDKEISKAKWIFRSYISNFNSSSQSLQSLVVHSYMLSVLLKASDGVHNHYDNNVILPLFRGPFQMVNHSNPIKMFGLKGESLSLS